MPKSTAEENTFGMRERHRNSPTILPDLRPFRSRYALQGVFGLSLKDATTFGAALKVRRVGPLGEKCLFVNVVRT